MSDPQIIINKLFEKLDQAKNNGEIQQATHALRVQITNKKNAGLKLEAREKAMLASVGEIKSPPATSGGPVRVIVTLIVLAIIGAVVWHFVGPMIMGAMK